MALGDRGASGNGVARPAQRRGAKRGRGWEEDGDGGGGECVVGIVGGVAASVESVGDGRDGGGCGGVSEWACRFCGKVLASASKIAVHERVHSGERPYACGVCVCVCAVCV